MIKGDLPVEKINGKAIMAYTSTSTDEIVS